ncbi:MAG TPA: antitoxin VapB family protein [Vicinamibacterales bacterium]|nr:antitoxin VapB family protein [Vicinamibacterales bacterium]
MAVKTITIDLEAYETLARRKRPGQSFSEVIKQHFAGGSTGQDLLEAVKRLSISEETLDAVGSQIRARRRSAARVPTW